jgi:hypothetical protein
MSVAWGESIAPVAIVRAFKSARVCTGPPRRATKQERRSRSVLAQRGEQWQARNHLVEQRSGCRVIGRRDKHFDGNPADPGSPGLADHFQISESVLQVAPDQRLDRIDREAPTARELAQTVDDLPSDRAERGLERRDMRRRIVEFDRTADRELAAADRDTRNRGSRRRHPERNGDGGHA